MQDCAQDADRILVEKRARGCGVESPEHRAIGAAHLAVGRNRAAAAGDLGQAERSERVHRVRREQT
jgi:hypothetical protein